MTNWLERLKTMTAHDWPGGLGADVETAVEKIEQLQAERDAYRAVAADLHVDYVTGGTASIEEARSIVDATVKREAAKAGKE